MADTELDQLSKTDRNPIQETRYQELLRQMGIPFSFQDNKAYIQGFGTGGNFATTEQFRKATKQPKPEKPKKEIKPKVEKVAKTTKKCKTCGQEHGATATTQPTSATPPKPTYHVAVYDYTTNPPRQIAPAGYF